MSVGVDIGAIAVDLQDIASFFIGGTCDDSSGGSDNSDDSDDGDGSDDSDGNSWDSEDPNSCDFWQGLMDSGIPVFSTDGGDFKKSKI
jgi:hypothetical protein